MMSGCVVCARCFNSSILFLMPFMLILSMILLLPLLIVVCECFVC